MTYKGWRIVVIVDIPRAFVIKDVQETYNHVSFGPEIAFHPKLRPEDYLHTMRFSADKDGRNLPPTRTYGGTKHLIDLEEEKT